MKTKKQTLPKPEADTGTKVTLEEARRKMQEAVYASCDQIIGAVIREAVQGKYLPAKFLFEAVGLLSPGIAGERESEPRSLAQWLLEPWHDGSSEEEESKVTKGTTEARKSTGSVP